VAGTQVQVCERKGVASVWSGGTQVCAVARRPRSQDSVLHAEQWKTVASVSAVRRALTPFGHVQPAPQVESRSFQEYDQSCGVATVQVVVA
jgi:hypothetical protein